MSERLQQMPFAVLTPCLATGIVLARLVADCCFLLLIGGVALLVAAAAAAFARDRMRTAAGASCAAVVLCGLAAALADDPGASTESVPFQLVHTRFPLGQLIQFEGCISEDVQQFEDETLLTLQLRGYRHNDRWNACRGGAYVRMPRIGATEQEAATDLKPGDRVHGWATWQLPRSYLNPGTRDRVESLRERGIHLVGRVKSPRILEVLPGDCGNVAENLLSAVRSRLRGTLERLKDKGMGKREAILASIVLGDATGLDPEVRDAFQNSGTYHVLVVSGLHVVWIAWVLLHVFKRLRVPEGTCRVLIMLGIAGYAGIVGNQASISRALWTYALYILGEAVYRRGHPANVALASAFLLLVIFPNWLFDAGFQLSFLSVLAITLTGTPVEEEYLRPLLHPSMRAGQDNHRIVQPGRAGRLGRRIRTEGVLLAEAIGDRLHPRAEVFALAAWRILAGGALAAASMVLVSVAVQIWIEPVLAYDFNRLSWISPLANLVIVPLSSIVLAVGGIAVICASVSDSLIVLLTPAGWLASLLFELALRISAIPGTWTRCPTPPGALVLAGALALFACGVLACRKRWLPYLGTAAILGALVLAPPPARWLRWIHDLAGGRATEMLPVPGTLQLTFLDVGQGDSTVVRFPDSRIWVVDAGGTPLPAAEHDRTPAFDIGEAVVSRYLWHLWVRRLDRLALSHPHQDHGGGMAALLGNFRAGEFTYGCDDGGPIMCRIRAAAKQHQVPVCRITSGEGWGVGAVRIRVLAPAVGTSPPTVNDGSVVLHLTYGRFSVLLPGDIQRATETELVTRWQDDLSSNLLKVAHHGSPSSTTDLFLNHVRPRWAVITAARNNPFGNPSPEVVLRLARRGTLPLLNMDHGAITFETDGLRYRVTSHVGGLLANGSLPPPSP